MILDAYFAANSIHPSGSAGAHWAIWLFLDKFGPSKDLLIALMVFLTF